MAFQITILPQKQNIAAGPGENLLDVLRAAGLAPDAPCGGAGTCGKCSVRINGNEALACRTVITDDMTIALSAGAYEQILTAEIAPAQRPSERREGYLLAFDIGTTTVVGYLLDGRTGQELACESTRNPQAAFGADVISRIRHALSGQLDALTACIRHCTAQITQHLCSQVQADPDEISMVCIVGNPAMQQLFLGISPENLARIPFAPALIRTEITDAVNYLPVCRRARLLIIPNISGFVGADTLACVLATGMDQREDMTLLVDIGTNGEMVLGNRHRMVACSTAAGPALEGANIQFGMCGQAGAIDHVRMEKGKLKCSVIGGAEAVGICGSGLIDAAAAALEGGLINSRGRIRDESRTICLTDRIWLTQEDIRELQAAKGAIAAGIALMSAHLGITLEQISKVYLAGAFGTFMDPESACAIGLLPSALRGKTEAVGNAAGSGAKCLVHDAAAPEYADRLVSRIEYLELAALPEFARCFAKAMRF